MKNAASTFSEKLFYLAKLLKVATEEKLSRMAILDNLIAQVEKVPYIPFPISFSTVDMIPVYKDSKGKIWLLLGRKYNQILFQFCGGFRDPKETNAEAAAREFWEEALLKAHPERFKPIGELFIDDNRYKTSPHKITTHIFKVNLTYKESISLQGGDDIEEVAWYSLDALKADPAQHIRPVHINLFNYVKDKL